MCLFSCCVNREANKSLFSLQNTDLCILPLTAVETLPATVAAFCSQLTLPQHGPATRGEGGNTDRLRGLLRIYAGTGSAPLPAETADRLIMATAAAKCAETPSTPSRPGRPAVCFRDVAAFLARYGEQASPTAARNQLSPWTGRRL